MIELVAFDESHFDPLIAWSDTPAFLLQWAGPGLQHPLTRTQLAALLESGQGEAPSAYLYGVRERASGELVGHAELGNVDRSSDSAKLMRILVGPQELRGRGLGEAVVRELVRVGFAELGLHRLELNVFDFNRGAIRCYERVGFRREGTLREARRNPHPPGREPEYWDVCVMGLLRGEWEGAG